MGRPECDGSLGGSDRPACDARSDARSDDCDCDCDCDCEDDGSDDDGGVDSDGGFTRLSATPSLAASSVSPAERPSRSRAPSGT
ncbi:hypothetical protein ABZ178_21165 [Streptomyces massasporeus]|uniref:hypothetical protein n=1 Tax=Streptomyces massasporeus TaxID=67324 RepID=UPI0033A47A99